MVTKERRAERGLLATGLALLGCSSPGAGTAGSLSAKLFIRLERRRSRPGLRAGEAEVGARWCRPALIVAAACRLERVGERGDGGLGRVVSVAASEMRRGRWWWARGEPGIEGGREVGRVLMSGAIDGGEEEGGVGEGETVLVN